MKRRGCLACVLCLAVLSGCARQHATQAKQEAGPVPIQVARIHTREIQRIVESVGTLYPFDETIVSAEIAGKIDQVNVDLGDVVNAGQALVHIDDEEQRYLLAQNVAQLNQSLERLGLKDEKDRVQDINTTPEVRRAQAELTEARQRHERVRQLVDQQIGSRSDLDQASARFQAAQAAYDATLNQTRNLIREVERFKAVVDLHRKNLRDTTVRAPFQAHIKERQVTLGQVVQQNTPLFTLVKIDPIRLRLEVPERMAPWIRNGQIAEILVEAFEGQKFQGKIWRISPTVDPTKRTFIVEALIANSEGRLKPGSYARARVPTNKTESIKLAPSAAVAYVLGSNKIYVVKGDTIDAREVKVGERFNGDVEIIDGVGEGEQVATRQLPRLDTGTKVRVESSGGAGAKAAAE